MPDSLGVIAPPQKVEKYFAITYQVFSPVTGTCAILSSLGLHISFLLRRSE